MRNSNITSSIDESHANSVSNSLILNLQKRIREIEKTKFEEDVNIAGLSGIIENHSKVRSQSSFDQNQVRLLTDEMETSNENMKISFDIISAEAELLVEQSVNNKMLEIIQDYFKEKNKKTL